MKVEYVQQMLLNAGFDYPETVVAKWTQYLNGMLLWNNAYNLTAITDPEEMVVRHLFDSIILLTHLSSYKGTGRIADVGSGAGLPGIPLSLLMPDCQFVLLDSSRKRTRFMQQMVFELGLENVEVVHARVQDYQPSVLFDIVLSRAFASAEDMIHWAAHLLKPEGVFAAMKGQITETEWQNIPQGWQTSFVSLEVPMLDEARHLVFLSCSRI